MVQFPCKILRGACLQGKVCILSEGVIMNFLKSFMVLSFLLTLTGCGPSSTLEGTVISSRAVGRGIIEHLIETNSLHTPYYILKVNNNSFHKGSKVVLEFLPDSMADRIN